MSASGKSFENQAVRLLKAQGLRLITRNFSCRPGEIDIIALDGNYLVFIEVRSRGNNRFNSAAGSVDRAKQRRIIQAAQLFLQQQPRYSNLPCRFDVIAFEPPQSALGRPVRWIRAAFTA